MEFLKEIIFLINIFMRTLSLMLFAIFLFFNAVKAVTPDPLILTYNDGKKPTSIIVRTDKAGLKASPLLHGIFVEDWSHQVEGGIYGELIRNRSFDDTNSLGETLVMGFLIQLPDTSTAAAKLIPNWVLENKSSIATVWTKDQSHAMNVNNVRCLQLNVNSVTGGRTGIYTTASVYQPGFKVVKDSTYLFSIWARTDTPNTALSVYLETAATTPALLTATQAITGLSTTGWVKYNLTFKATTSSTNARVFIQPTVVGTYYLDMISLFPKATWKNRPNGLRTDVMEMVAALKPAFVRFPGGCFVEGLGYMNSFQWKKTIGPVEERQGHWNIWGWRSSDGMGYFEYLQMCEDLSSEPLLVINDGIAHHKDFPSGGVYDSVPMANMDTVVRDAMDAIEYANGDASTVWGAKRIAVGHAASFNLKYIEIGNENNGVPGYDLRYILFFNAIKAKYPNMNIIINTNDKMVYPAGYKPYAGDIHKFAPAFWFTNAYDMFDNADRNGPNVYFGEWCVDLEVPNKSTLLSGLSEAVFLTGLEKNSDIVTMQSYAPFMNNLPWNNLDKPNMINFDGTGVFGTPIYWMQKMYAENKVDSIFDFSVSSPDLKMKVGRVGFGGSKAQVQIKDYKVVSSTGQTLIDGNVDTKDSFNPFSNWTLTGGVFTYSATSTTPLYYKYELSGDFTMTMNVMKTADTGNTGGINIYFQPDTFWALGSDNNTTQKVMGSNIVNLGWTNFSVALNVWYAVKIEVKGNQILCYLNGKLTNRAYYDPLNSLYVAAGKVKATKDVIVKVVNISPNSQTTRIQLPGVTILPNATATVITATDPLSKNSLATPNLVIPVTSTISNASNDFSYTFLPYSVTVLKLKQ
jgi:alpha-L-arabinofuranosidase